MFYVFFGATSTVQIYKLTLNRQQSLSALPQVVQRAVAADDLNIVTEWVRFRPLAETAPLTDILLPLSGRLDFGIFFELARRQLQAGHTEEALFWLQVGRFRMRFDVLRCGVPGGQEAFDKILTLFTSPAIRELLEKNPVLVKTSVRRVLDFDTKYPAHNVPTYTCRVEQQLSSANIVHPIEQKDWESVRQDLHAAAEDFLGKDVSKNPTNRHE